MFKYWRRCERAKKSKRFLKPEGERIVEEVLLCVWRKGRRGEGWLGAWL